MYPTHHKPHRRPPHKDSPGTGTLVAVLLAIILMGFGFAWLVHRADKIVVAPPVVVVPAPTPAPAPAEVVPTPKPQPEPEQYTPTPNPYNPPEHNPLVPNETFGKPQQ